MTGGQPLSSTVTTAASDMALPCSFDTWTETTTCHVLLPFSIVCEAVHKYSRRRARLDFAHLASVASGIGQGGYLHPHVLLGMLFQRHARAQPLITQQRMPFRLRNKLNSIALCDCHICRMPHKARRPAICSLDLGISAMRTIAMAWFGPKQVQFACPGGQTRTHKA